MPRAGSIGAAGLFTGVPPPIQPFSVLAIEAFPSGLHVVKADLALVAGIYPKLVVVAVAKRDCHEIGRLLLRVPARLAVVRLCGAILPHVVFVADAARHCANHIQVSRVAGLCDAHLLADWLAGEVHGINVSCRIFEATSFRVME